MTILNEYWVSIQAGYTSGFSWGFVICSLITILFAIGVIRAIATDIKYRTVSILPSTLALAIVVTLAISCFFIYTSKPVYKDVKEYEVLINDDYPVKEFFEKYNLIENRGDIYIIQDKEVERLGGKALNGDY